MIEANAGVSGGYASFVGCVRMPKDVRVHRGRLLEFEMDVITKATLDRIVPIFDRQRIAAEKRRGMKNLLDIASGPSEIEELIDTTHNPEELEALYQRILDAARSGDWRRCLA